MIVMATKSFFKEITIKNRKSADKFINALENAENKKSKVIEIDKMAKNVTDGSTIRKIFKKQNMRYKIINLEYLKKLFEA